MNDIITFVFSSGVYLYILFVSFRYVRRADKSDANRRLIIALLVVLLLSGMAFSWGVTNTGTAARHRDKFIAIYMVLYVLSSGARPRFNTRRNR